MPGPSTAPPQSRIPTTPARKLAAVLATAAHPCTAPCGLPVNSHRDSCSTPSYCSGSRPPTPGPDPLCCWSTARRHVHPESPPVPLGHHCSRCQQSHRAARSGCHGLARSPRTLLRMETVEAETTPGTCIWRSTTCSKASTSTSAEICMPGCATGMKIGVFSQSAVR